MNGCSTLAQAMDGEVWGTRQWDDVASQPEHLAVTGEPRGMRARRPRGPRSRSVSGAANGDASEAAVAYAP